MSFIWYNHHQETVQIWGLTDDIKNAVNMLNCKLTSIIENERHNDCHLINQSLQNDTDQLITTHTN